ncbi:MAG: VanW family protein [Eubacteriales bacterium]|nr:VanW family protein [Eubacteriales bacterium]
MKIAVGGVVLMLAIVCIVFLLKGMGGGPKEESAAETETTQEPETELQKEVMVDGVNITGMSREEAKNAILADFGWGMKVVWEDKTYDVADLMSGKVDALLESIFTGEPQESYTLDTSGLEETVKAEAANVAAQWDKKPKNGSISSFDASSGKFVFAGAESGLAVDQEKLAADMLGALSSKDFDALIQASVSAVEPEISEASAKEKYKTISSFTTKTTSNSKRNNNIKLSAEAINGIVLQPGEEFSFNDRVGERTEAKGYKGAAAYNNGEVVEEIGGGVCQTSSTLYNAVLKAGLKTTVRRSHTFEPSYVTPGTDATVSWGGPDYKFVNNSSTAVGIRAHYANQEITISIYGIPILEDGVSYSLKSTKIKDMDPPAPTYEEDGSLEPGVEKTKSAGSKGSYWETRLVVSKNGEVVSQEIDHTVTYKGHAPVILRNTSGTVAPTQPQATTAPAETIIDPNSATEAVPAETETVPVTGPNGGPGVVSGPGVSQNQSTQSAGPSGGGTAPTTASPSPGGSSAVSGSGAPGSSAAEAPGQSSGPVSAPGSQDNVTMVSPGPGN